MNTLQWLHKLIRFNTISSNSNKSLIEAVHAWFTLHQIPVAIIPGTTEGKFNLLATIPAKDGKTSGGILLSGHTDVVPVLGQPWSTDPFIAHEQDGKVYGRGTCDMKGFLAVLLALAPEFKTLNLIKPIHLAFTCDEEIGCLGVDYLVSYIEAQNLHPEGCIIGEPSGMRPIIGEKARRLYRCQVHGKAVHSSLAPQGCNAIEYASRLISYISSLAQHVKENGPFDPAFDVPFTTITTNLISGGTAQNIIPGFCEFTVELRYIDEFPLTNFHNQVQQFISGELEVEMQKNCPEAFISFEIADEALGFHADEEAEITRLVRTVTGIKDRFKVSFATESGPIQNAGIPTVICGPGDIQQAHKTNEFITLDQLELCEKVLRNVVHFFCTDLST